MPVPDGTHGQDCVARGRGGACGPHGATAGGSRTAGADSHEDEPHRQGAGSVPSAPPAVPAGSTAGPMCVASSGAAVVAGVSDTRGQGWVRG